MIFKHCSLIQEGEAVLFYRFNRPLNGYVINGILVANNISAKLAFVKIWKYFVSEVVRNDDIYAAIVPGVENSMFDNHLSFYATVDGLKIYKVDNSIKEQYSSYVQHLKGQTNGK